MRLALFLLTLTLPAQTWTPLFDGQSLNGWTPAENKSSWSVRDGKLSFSGPRSHLFYTGPLATPLQNFELEAEAMLEPGANSGVYFHTEYQESGFLKKGYEAQLNNTHKGEGSYVENKRTGSLYGIRNVYKKIANDNEWITLNIRVTGKHIEIRVNGLLTASYTEPTNPLRDGDSAGRLLSSGTIALQGHDAGSKVQFRSVKIRQLPADAGRQYTQPTFDTHQLRIERLARANYPLVDYHVHPKGGLSIEQAVSNSYALGINYGLALNVGLGFPVQNDAGALEFLNAIKDKPVFAAIQGEGREWITLLSPATRARFDYAFTDALTWTNDNGKRMRLWLKDEVEIGDPQNFMDQYVARIEKILREEPIDIFVNPTFLPDAIASRYDELWTPERRQRVIDAAQKRGIAIEINNRYRIPSLAFIQQAKQAGIKFACGTNNADPNVGRSEYCLDMIEQAQLKPADIWLPKRERERVLTH